MSSSDNQNITFRDLNEFVNEWFVRTQDFEIDFYNQAAESLKLFKLVGNNEEKLKEINYRLNILNHLYKMLQENIKIIGVYQQELERAIEELEILYEEVCPNEIVFDHCRHKMYNNILQLNNAFKSINGDIKNIKKQTALKDRNDLKYPLESIVRILMSELTNLETVEGKIHKAYDMLQIIECKKKQLAMAM